MLPENKVKELLSIEYIRVVCAMAGYICEKNEQDYGFDLTIKNVKKRLSGKYYPEGYNIDIQAKATTKQTMTDSVVKYSLKNKNYNDLRDPEAGTPSILVILILPKERNDWMNQDVNSLVMKKCAYWICLKGRDPKQNEDSKTTLEIPKQNIFSVKQLQSMIEQVKKGGDISDLSN